MNISDKDSKRLNDAIHDLGYIYNPSLTYLLSLDILPFHIDDESKKILKHNLDTTYINYDRMIFPRLENILEVLVSDNINVKTLRVEPFDRIRTRLRDAYFHPINESLDLETDTSNLTTLDGLTSKAPMANENRYVQFSYDKGHKYIIALRRKDPEKLQQKLKSKVKEINLEGSGDYLSKFILEVCESPNAYWEPETNLDYSRRYCESINNILVGDIVGAKIIDLNYSRAQKRMEELASHGPNLFINGFKNIPQRFNDHRERVKDYKPGGVHYTFTDVALNFPLEVQYLDLLSQIYDMFGPNAHPLYTLRGKKKSN